MGRAAGSARVVVRRGGERKRPRGDAPQLRARLPVRAPSAEGTKAAGAKESPGDARRRRSGQRSSGCREWQPRRQSLRRLLPQDCLPASARLLLIASSAGEPTAGTGALERDPQLRSATLSSSFPGKENSSRQQPRDDCRRRDARHGGRRGATQERKAAAGSWRSSGGR